MGMWWASVLDMLVHGEEPQPMPSGKATAKRKPLGKGLSSYQLFKAALDFLGKCTYKLYLLTSELVMSQHGIISRNNLSSLSPRVDTGSVGPFIIMLNANDGRNVVSSGDLR